MALKGGENKGPNGPNESLSFSLSLSIPLHPFYPLLILFISVLLLALFPLSLLASPCCSFFFFFLSTTANGGRYPGLAFGPEDAGGSLAGRSGGGGVGAWRRRRRNVDNIPNIISSAESEKKREGKGKTSPLKSVEKCEC